MTTDQLLAEYLDAYCAWEASLSHLPLDRRPITEPNNPLYVRSNHLRKLWQQSQSGETK